MPKHYSKKNKTKQRRINSRKTKKQHGGAGAIARASTMRGTISRELSKSLGEELIKKINQLEEAIAHGPKTGPMSVPEIKKKRNAIIKELMEMIDTKLGLPSNNTRKTHFESGLHRNPFES